MIFIIITVIFDIMKAFSTHAYYVLSPLGDSGGAGLGLSAPVGVEPCPPVLPGRVGGDVFYHVPPSLLACCPRGHPWTLL